MTVEERVLPGRDVQAGSRLAQHGLDQFRPVPPARQVQGLQARLGEAASGGDARPRLPQHLQGHRVHPRRPATTTARASSSSATTSRHLYNLAHFADRGLVKPPFFVQSVFGILGGIGTHPEDVAHMKRTADRLFGDEYRWSVLGAGAASCASRRSRRRMGGNVRVGLEDSLWAGTGKLAKSNAEQVRAGAQDHRRARPRGRDAGRGARDPGAEGRRQGRVLSRLEEETMLRIEVSERQARPARRRAALGRREQRLYWIDSYGPGDPFAAMPTGGDRRSWDVPEPIGSMALREKGGAILSLRDGFYSFDFADGRGRRASHETQPGELRPRMNDGKVDRQGRFVAGSMDFEESEPRRQAVPARSGPLACIRSTAASSARTVRAGAPTARPSTSPTRGRRVIWAYDYDTRPARRAVAPRLHELRDQRGLPDGATVDAEGYVWSAEVYSGRLIRFDPNGVVDRIVGLPVAVDHEPDLRRAGSRHRLCHLDGEAIPASAIIGSARPAASLPSTASACAASPEPRFKG